MHHLIPDVVAQSHPLIRTAMERLKGYTIDRGSNVLDMPSGINVEGQLIHSGSHPRYSDFVRARLELGWKSLSRKGPPPVGRPRSSRTRSSRSRTSCARPSNPGA
ncbi:hypothetical protein D7X99_40130 [Corallococcus sp. AB032C]|nr:hypothetical protein D7X99_40130 [Corallococcus sp. AB032C]